MRWGVRGVAGQVQHANARRLLVIGCCVYLGGLNIEKREVVVGVRVYLGCPMLKT